MNWKDVFEKSNFWAVQYAKKAIEKAKSKGKDCVCVRCAATPSGVLHIGNANEIIRSYLIAKSIEVLGFKAKMIYTSDDRDPLRSLPKYIADKKGNLVETPKNFKEEFEKKYKGQPVCLVPDPFKCHTSWSEHFLSLFFRELEELGIFDSIEFEYYSPNILYSQGEWEEYVKKVLEEKEKVKKIYSGFKQHIKEYAFNPICENCSKIASTVVLEYDKEKEKVRYLCKGRKLKKGEVDVEGCGYEGLSNLKSGKVDWYIEWAINWDYFDADIEVMGKDHAVSSFKVSPKFLKELYGKEPPIPVPYEMFLVDGEKMSSSKGNIYTITELLKMLEPEVIIYFYTKRPTQQRNLELRNLNTLVDEWDSLEKRVYDGSANNEELCIYYLCMRGRIPEKKPVRIPYLFASVIGQLLKDKNKIIEVLTRTKHIDDHIQEEDLDRTFERIKKASYWAKKYGPDFIKIKIIDEPVEVSEDIKPILQDISEKLKKLEDWTPDSIQSVVVAEAKKHPNPKKVYEGIYKLFLGKSQGPKIGTLFSILDKDFVISKLSS